MFSVEEVQQLHGFCAMLFESFSAVTLGVGQVSIGKWKII